MVTVKNSEAALTRDAFSHQFVLPSIQYFLSTEHQGQVWQLWGLEMDYGTKLSEIANNSRV
jgi:hypothetical protein